MITELKRFLKWKKGEAGEVKSADAKSLPAPEMESEVSVSSEVLGRRPALLEKIKEEEQQIWPELCKTKAMDEIEQFASRLKGWAEEGQWPALLRYAENLDQQVQEFDVARLPKTLQDFPNIIDSLS